MIGDQIKKKRVELDMTQAELAQKISVKANTISNYEKGISSPSEDIIYKLMDALKCDANFLFEWLTEEQKKISPEEASLVTLWRDLDSYGKRAVKSILEIESDRCASEEPEVKLISLPKSELKASAGTGFMLDGDYTSWVKVPDTPTARQANIVIEVTGDSMVPMFSDGDNVLVRLTPDIDIGDVGIFSVDGNGYIKKKGRGKLISVNPAYDDIEVGEYSDYRCFGKVLGKVEIIE